MEFFNNKSNDTLKFKLNSEGVDTETIEARLILVSEGKNYLFFGNINDEVCTFSIPELKQYEKNDNGKIKFEIISDDLYFPVWEDNFSVNTKVNITLEQVVSNVAEETKTTQKPKISVAQPIVEVIKEEKKVVKPITQKVDEKNSSTKVKGFGNFKR